MAAWEATSVATAGPPRSTPVTELLTLDVRQLSVCSRLSPGVYAYLGEAVRARTSLPPPSLLQFPQASDFSKSPGAKNLQLMEEFIEVTAVTHREHNFMDKILGG